MNKTTDEETIHSNRISSHPEDLEKSKSEEIPKTDNIKEERTDGLDDQTNLLPTKQVILVFLGLSAALFCSLLDQTIVSTILPSINHEFNAANEGSWVATSYLLTSTAFMPIHSRLSDLIGRKTVLQVCLALFFIGSLACAVSKTIEELIVFRAIAGVGGGGILNNVMVSISDIVSLRERGKYQGILGVVVSVANSLGPLLGGVFTETIGWRWAFWINLPLTGVAILIVQFFLPFKRVGGNWREKARRIDYAGSIIILASTILILLPLNWGGNKYAWDSAVVLALLIVGLLLIVVFILVENCKKIVDLPILPMHLFKNRSVSASYTCTFFSGCIFYGALYYLPQYLQVVAGYSPLKSGVILLSLILSQTLFSFTAGLIVSKTGNYMWNIWTGFMLWTIGIGLLTTLRPDTKLANFIGYCVIAGVGAGNTFQTTLLSVQAAVSRQDMAVATGGTWMSFRIQGFNADDRA
ncbi:MFS general substrate transporter [Wallemia mellicola]|uniref:MFS general substrate transporter n=1 Tax=Wallemia mellicola TaxID=1708541 RepID=A0A4T0P2E2_9BASI|nr:MFS general substrate transporter [Wallemia mellicola]TIB92792.1 MFS general substrate transporter [Wallemia mellicola]TIC04231.1 MFS general substrate transporter [Wallemia mellicola]TIC44506.1 MFS general substrate transporter [Wallemia mellicola]TIC53663.1 MFS general substrate transporter [Wallemia mellicola]